ncbi:MAG TPA: hypothetical protein VJS88_06700, partial [Chthoniobacterales bacterium]|nr:hypothetical protein [Chthoniobacterales bacterium]
MQKNSGSESGVFHPRIFTAFVLCLIGALLTMFSVAEPPPRTNGPAATNATPTFGHPVISGIGGLGFEEAVRIDPTNPDRIYTSAPGTASADTSWIWHSLDGGKTFKWVVGATAFEGKVTTCHGGGDTEIAVDSAGHLYFNDLTLANFSTARSDDFGATFTCSNTGVPDAAVDRQWYAIDGDPTNGGSIYLANDEIGPGGAVCGSSAANNVLVMYRSPALGLGPTAGIEFGPANKITAVGSCDEAIMGNNEISPIATSTGQPDGAGGYATLATAVKHIYVIHDNALLNKILIGRCFPVAFGAPVANVSDPSGLNCTDLLVADLGTSTKTGGSFPTMAIDKAGNLYAVWEEAPIDADGNIVGDTVLKYSYSTNEGNTWAAPIKIETSGSPAGELHNNVFAWMAAGDDGRVNIVWYGTPALSNPDDPTCGVNALLPPMQGKNINGPDSVNGLWSLWMVQSLNAHDPAGPTFTAPILASEHHIHRGSVQTLMGGQCGNRSLGDFLQLRTGVLGEAHISYADSNNIIGSAAGHAMYVRQNGGDGLFAANSPVNVPGLSPLNAVSDPAGDGKYEVNGISSASMPQLDILSSTVSKVTAAPCSTAEPCYKITMELNDLSLAPTTAQDPDPDLVWLTQWFVPSTSDPNGGKNFHVYAESTNGADLQCFVGENAVQLIGGGGVITYPGATTLPAENCQSTLGPNGTITIFVPVSAVAEADPIDNKLHEVTASTMTLAQPANSTPSFGGVGGSLFNLIDVAQVYVFDPAGAPSPSPTPSPSTSPTASPAATATPTPTPSPSASPAATPTPTPTPSPSGTPSPSPTPSPTPTPANVELLNISGRVVTQTGDKVGIAGFIVKGSGFKRFIARAIGPSMKINGVPVAGRLMDPILELHDSNGSTLTNDNWRTGGQESQIQQTGLAPGDNREAAIIRTVPPGNFTAIIRGANNAPGIGLIEVYDLGSVSAGESEERIAGPDASEAVIELGNLSVRADVQTDDNVLIDGIILRGGNSKRVLFRALGPSVKANGTPVPGRLQDPILELRDA